MGGSHEHLPEVPLCRTDHESLHRGEWAFSRQHGFYVGTKGGDFRSPVHYDDQNDDARFWTLERIARAWHELDGAAVELYRAQCEAAWVLKERFCWMPEWYEQAAKTLSVNEERPVAWQRVYDRVKAYETFELRLGGGDVWRDVYLIGERLRLAVARSKDPEGALAEAVTERLAGATVSQIERALKGDSNELERERCTCDRCGQEHWRKG